MSATSELLYEQVEELQHKLDEVRSKGEDTTELEKQMKELREKLVAATSALNEGKTLLKG
jgi:uncharacterized coiled-coil DUF342 family protein